MEKFECFNKINWCGYQWIMRPPWGDNHPMEEHSWYDEGCTEIDENNNLILHIRHNPKECDVPGREKLLKEFGKGFVRTVDEFKYGTFEWEMKLPQGRYLWPALWMASDYSWPPEIDCMEGWSKNTTDYVKRLLWRDIHPTMHWSKGCNANDEHLQECKYNILRWWVKRNKFVHYKVVWTPNYIDVFYDGHKVKRFTDKGMLEHMNRPEIKMHAIMSTSFNDPFIYFYDEYVSINKPMIIKNFKYTPLK